MKEPKYTIATMPPIIWEVSAIIGFIIGMFVGMWGTTWHQKQAISYSTYEVECWADSTRSPCGRAIGFTAKDGSFSGVYFEPVYTHRTPTMEGYGEWVKERTK